VQRRCPMRISMIERFQQDTVTYQYADLSSLNWHDVQSDARRSS
jgi:hypothetical protein